jgi:hypothetical protein
MLRAYKFRLWTNANQERELSITLETHRRLYNSALAQRKESWEERQETSLNRPGKRAEMARDRVLSRGEGHHGRTPVRNAPTGHKILGRVVVLKSVVLIISRLLSHRGLTRLD